MRTHGLSLDATYRVWTAIFQRCCNPKCRSYPDYGGRGILVSPDWDAFEGFVRDMGLRPPGATIDRIDTNGNYEKSNCRWVSPQLQNRNRRSTKLTALSASEIRKRVEAGERPTRLAAEFNTSVSNICNVIARRSWKDVE